MYIRMPNNYRIFLDNNVSSHEERIKKVKDIILDYNNGYWNEWFNIMWLNEVSIAGKPINMTKQILDRLATYILLGNYKDANILTKNKENRINQTEIPVSSTEGSNVYDYFYSTLYDEDNNSNAVQISNRLTNAEVDKDVYSMDENDFKRTAKREKKLKKKWKKTKTYKLNSLRSTKQIKTYVIKPVIYKDKTGKTRTLKTPDGNVVVDTFPKTIGGRNGIIGLNEPFIAEWRYVDADNNFEFNGKCYQIDDSVSQYTVFNKGQVITGTITNDFTNESLMEKILCVYLPNKDKIYFFDENIDMISPELIHQKEKV